jgi:hypothetical protein
LGTSETGAKYVEISYSAAVGSDVEFGGSCTRAPIETIHEHGSRNFKEAASHNQ